MMGRNRRPRAAALSALVALVIALAAFAAPPLATPPGQTAAPTLADVFAAIDHAAPGLHALSAQADVADYTALVNDTDRSSGHFYYKSGTAGPMYALELTQPAASARTFVYRDRTAYVYTPASHQVMKYALGAKPELINQFLQLGVGATSAELTKTYQVALDGPASLDGVATVKLTLTPIAATLRDKFPHIDLWYDVHTWVAVQQQLWQPGGDYHLVHYTKVEVNPRLSDDRFPAKFPGATVIVPGQ